MATEFYRKFGLTAADLDIREKIVKDIEKKAKACSNPTYNCTLMRIDGQEYCPRHILRDPRSNYRQCTFIYFNGKKCINPLPRLDHKKDLTTFCFEHSRQAQLKRTYTTVGRLKRPETNEVLLNSLAHHVKVEKPKKQPQEEEEVIDVVSPYVPPFIHQDSVQDISTIPANIRKRRRNLDYASDNSSESEEFPTIQNTNGALEDYSGTDGDESLDEDLLRHANVYTHEEVVRLVGTKLNKLKSLYTEEVHFLQRVLKERRRQFIHSVRKERETHCSIHSQVKNTPKQRRLYKKLKALNSFHHRRGQDSLMFKKFKEKRTRTNEGLIHNKGPIFTKCIFTEGGVKCGLRVLPCTKHCFKHILSDKKQVYFRGCGVERDNVTCIEPVPMSSDSATCIWHMLLPDKKQFTLKKDETDTDDEEGAAKRKRKLEEAHDVQYKEPAKLILMDSSKMIDSQILSNESPDCNITIAHV